METWMIIVLVLLIFGLSFFVLKALASMDIFFTYVQTNHIKFIERGGSEAEGNGVLKFILAEIPGKILDLEAAKGNFKKAEIRELREGEEQVHNTFLYRRFGMYFYGFYPFSRVKKLKIIREKENVVGTGPHDWIINEGIKFVTGLRAVFPRVFVFTSVELKDGFTVHIKLVVKLKVVVPYIVVYEFGAHFFTQVSSILESEVIDEVRKVSTIQDFIDLPKGESDGVLKDYKNRPPENTGYSKVNQEMVRQVGLCITGIAINDWAPGDKETEALMKKVATAQIEGSARVEKEKKDKEAEIVAAEKYAKVLEIKTTADVDRGNKMTDVRARYIRETVANIASTNADPNTTAQMTGKVLQSEEIAKSNLTTWVEGSDNTKPVVPVGGNK